jgi:hypothetical protein
MARGSSSLLPGHSMATLLQGGGAALPGVDDADLLQCGAATGGHDRRCCSVAPLREGRGRWRCHMGARRRR